VKPALEWKAKILMIKDIPEGALVGYGGGLARKRWLLDHELRTAGVVLR